VQDLPEVERMRMNMRLEIEDDLEELTAFYG